MAQICPRCWKIRNLSALLENKIPTRDGYTFAGWYYSSDFNDENKVKVGDTMPSKDLVLYAKWDVNSYKLTLNITIDGGTVDAATIAKKLGLEESAVEVEGGDGSYTVKITVPYETNLSALNTIEFGDYRLSGTWTHDEDGNVLLTFMPASDYTVSGEFTASAGDVTVTFYLTGDTVVYYKTTVSSGTVIGKLPEPTRTGYKFIEWRTAEGKKFDLNTPITEETKLYAHWEVSKYDVTLRGEGVNLDPIKVAYGTTLTWSEGGLLPVPVRGGYTFEGWYLDADFSTTAEWTFMPAYDITLYAKWEATEYSIVFKWGLNKENTVTISGGYNSALDLSSVGGAVPHYTFVWQVTADKKEPIEVTLDDFRTMPNLMAQYADYTSVVGGRVTITVQAAYTPIGYEITLEGADPVTVTVKTEGRNSFTELDDDKTGYTFAGWKLSADDTAAYNYYMVGENGGEWGVWLYSDEVSADGYFVPFTEGFSLDLTAAYTANTYTVKFDLNYEGSTGNPSNIKVTYDSVYGILPVPTRNGYTFDGWFTEQEGGTQITANDVVKITADQTLFAHWTAIEYNIIYNPGIGTNNPENPPVYTYESAFEFKAPTEPEGYKFVGWFNAANNEKISGITEGRTGDLTLIAQYKPMEYTVTFEVNGNGATVDPLKKDVTFGSVYGELPVPTCNGYTFDGWYLNDELVNADTRVTTADNHTLTAHWKVIEYTIVYNGLRGTEHSNPTLYTIESDEIELKAPTSVPTGYTFDGWYNGEDEVTTIPAGSYGNLTLTAEATFGQSYRFTLKAKDGYLLPATVTVTVGAQTYRVAVGTGGAVVIPPVYVTGNITIEAVGVADSYTVKFDGGTSATGAMNDQTVLYNRETTLTKNGFVQLGYEFLGWAYSDNADSPEIENGTIWINADWLAEHAGDIQDKTITLHAVWEVRTYTLKLEANGGDFVDEISSSVTGTYGGYFVLLDAKAFKVREGYTFLGWSTSASGESVLYNGGASVPVQLFTNGLAEAGSVGTLYAVWTKNSYTVMFNANGGTGNMGDMTFTYGTAQKLSMNAFTRTGYTFAGWATNSKATNIEYADGVSVINLSKENGGRVTLYAVWKANSYTIAYEGDGVNIASTSGTFGSAITLTDPTRQGFIFLGWYIGDNEGTRYRGSVSVGMLASAARVEDQDKGRRSRQS